MPKARIDPAIRFWALVKKTEGCWLWIGTRPGHRKRYGRFMLRRGFPVLAHRYSWELAFGPIEGGLYVCHTCDNPACVRPDHLFLGTAKDNGQDMASKGRSCKGRKRPGTGPAGERNTKAKLSIAGVAELRREFAAGGFTYRSIAAKYGIGKSQVGNILSQKHWTEESGASH